MKVRVYQYPKSYTIHDVKTGIEHHKGIDYELLLSEPANRIFMSEEIYKLQEQFSGLPTLTAVCPQSSRGIEGYKYQYEPTAVNADWLPFFAGQIYRYAVTGNGPKYVDFARHRDDADYLSFFKGKRILVRRIISRRNRLQAMVVNDDFVVGKDLYSFLVGDPNYDIRYLLAVLNSTLISYLYYMRSTVAQKDDFRQTTLDEIRHLAIVGADQTVQDEVAADVDRLVELKRKIQELAFKDDLRTYYHTQPIGEIPLSKILRWHSLKSRSEKRILDRVRRRGVVTNVEISEKTDWLTFVVSGREKPQEKEFAQLPLFSVRVKDSNLRTYIMTLLRGREITPLSKQSILDAVLDQRLPRFAPNLRKNTSEISKIVDAYRAALLAYKQLTGEMRETEARIDAAIFLTYQVRPDAAKVIMESLERDATSAASPVAEVDLDEDYQRRVLEIMRKRASGKSKS